jgi:hypothetical protein
MERRDHLKAPPALPLGKSPPYLSHMKLGGPQFALDVLEKKNKCSCPRKESELEFSEVQTLFVITTALRKWLGIK